MAYFPFKLTVLLTTGNVREDRKKYLTR